VLLLTKVCVGGTANIRVGASATAAVHSFTHAYCNNRHFIFVFYRFVIASPLPSTSGARQLQTNLIPSHRLSPRHPVQDKSEQIRSLPALTATFFVPFTPVSLLFLGIWTMAINISHNYVAAVSSSNSLVSKLLINFFTFFLHFLYIRRSVNTRTHTPRTSFSPVQVSTVVGPL